MTTRSTFKAIFWDNDGVLVDTENVYFEANRQVFAEIGLELSLERFIDVSLVQGKSLFDPLIGSGWSGERIRELKRIRDRRYGVLLEKRWESLAIPGVRECVERLAKTHFIAIVTSCRPKHFDIIHRRSNLLPLFQFVIKNGDYARSKPHPDPYLAALEKSGFAPEECLVVEDSERGLRSAVAAGLRCVMIQHDLSKDADLSAATAVVPNVRALEKWIQD